MQFKKVLISLLVIVLLFSMTVFAASATETVEYLEFAVETNFTADSEGKIVVKGGDEVEVTVKIDSNPGVAYFQIDLVYDSEAVTPVTTADGKLDYTSALYDVRKAYIDAEASKIEIITELWNPPELDKTGDFVTLKFKVNDSFKGTTEIGIENLRARDSLNEKVETKVTSVTFASVATGSNAGQEGGETSGVLETIDLTEEESGCGSSVSLGAIALVPVFGCGVVIARKRKNND